MSRKAFVLSIATDWGNFEVVCTVPDDSPQTLARLLGGKYQKGAGHPCINFSDIWDTLPPFREDTPGLENLARDLLADGESLDDERVLAVGPVNIALGENTKTLFIIEVPLVALSPE